MSEEELMAMKKDAMNALQEAITKLHNYACACDIGDERTRAFEVFENARTASRVG